MPDFPVPKPFYCSRIFWFGIPGLVFLLRGWWDSGANYSKFTVAAPGEFQLGLDVSSGWIVMSWQPGSPRQWVCSMDRWPVDRYEEAEKSGAPRPRQFDWAPALSVRKEMDDMGSKDLLPPGATYVPYVEWSIKVAFWLLALGYVLMGMLLLGGWQRRKARRLLEKSSAVPSP